VDGGERAPGGDLSGRPEACASAVHEVATAVLSGTVTFAVVGRCLGPENGLAFSADVVSVRDGATFDMSAESLTPGAYAPLARKVGTARLNKLLMLERRVTAGELVAMGIADALHEGEDSREEADRLLAKMRRRSNGEAATYLARERVSPLDIETVRACASMAAGGERSAA
jgi:enoyl-CoA hydratase/carnithine racemase